MSTKEKNMDERIAFGNSLSEKRRESGFSQEELGLKIGKSSNAVSRYENAENTMDVHTFAKTVNALKASPYELLKDLEVPEPDSKIVSLFFQIQRLDKNKRSLHYQWWNPCLIIWQVFKNLGLALTYKNE